MFASILYTGLAWCSEHRGTEVVEFQLLRDPAVVRSLSNELLNWTLPGRNICSPRSDHTVQTSQKTSHALNAKAHSTDRPDTKVCCTEEEEGCPILVITSHQHYITVLWTLSA